MTDPFHRLYEYTQDDLDELGLERVSEATIDRAREIYELVPEKEKLNIYLWKDDVPCVGMEKYPDGHLYLIEVQEDGGVFHMDQPLPNPVKSDDEYYWTHQEFLEYLNGKHR